MENTPSNSIDLYDEYHKRIYSSPFFDLSKFYMPKDFKQFFTWARYYFMTNHLISPVIKQMAQYPVTNLTYLTDDDDVREVYSTIFEDYLRLQDVLVEVGSDYFAYGNAFVSLHIPFKRTLICPACKTRFNAEDVKYKFRLYKMQFNGNCNHCKKNVNFTPKDDMVRLPKKFNIVRYYPGDIFIKYNSLTGEHQYQYKIPSKMEFFIKKGDKFFIDTTPLMYIQAVSKGSKVVFKNDRIFHFKRPSIAGMDQEWGMPILLPALKKAFYMQILQKAQEAIAIQHIVPLTILFPEANAGQSPYEMLNLGRWKDEVDKAIRSWKKDPNYIGIMPFPVGIKPLFGQGRALLVTPEVREAAIQVVAAMGVPQEFVFGGLSWSASSINLRMLENQFMSYRTLMKKFVEFIRDQVAIALRLPKIGVDFKEFKMIDDVQQKNLIMSLNASQKVSDETLLNTIGKDFEDEMKKIDEETNKRFERERIRLLKNTKLQGEQMMENAKYQALSQIEGQRVMMENQNKSQPPGIDLSGHYQSQLQGLPPEEQNRIMEEMQKQMPNLHEQVSKKRELEMATQANNSGNLPEQRPPRRVG